MSFSSLAVEVIALVLGFLSDRRDRCEARLVSRKWYDAMTSLLEDELTAQIGEEGHWEPKAPWWPFIVSHIPKMASELLQSIVSLHFLPLKDDDRGETTVSVLHALVQRECSSSVRSISFSKCTVSETSLKTLLKFSAIEFLTFYVCGIYGEENLGNLVRLPSLRSLDVSFCSQLTELCSWDFDVPPNLTSLQLSWSGAITPLTLSKLARLRNLQTLHLSGATSLKNVEELTMLPELKTLGLKQCLEIGDEGIACLTRAANLASLDLSYCSMITDAGVMKVCRCSNLKKLNLSRCNITDACIVAVANALNERLEALHLDGCSRVTDSSIAALSKTASALKSLHVSRCHVTDAGFLQLVRFRALEELSLAGPPPDITETALFQLSRLSSCLQFLDLSGSRVTDDCLKELASAHSTLRALSLDHCTLLSDIAVKDIGKIKSLRRLLLSETSITDKGVEELLALPALEHLDLSKCKNLTDACADVLLRMPSLKRYSLMYCTQISPGKTAALQKRLVSEAISEVCVQEHFEEKKRRVKACQVM